MVGFSFSVTDGPDDGRTFSLGHGVTIIGRLDVPSPDDPSDSSRWILTDPAVSRTHAQITWDGEHAPVLMHLSTTNATLLDGRIVTGQSLEQGQSLSNGQILRLGQSTLEVKEISAQQNWMVREEGDEIALDDARWNEGGLSFIASGRSTQVSLNNAQLEAYLLRRLEEQWWTTELRLETAVTVQPGDILRLDRRRLEIVSSEG